MSRQVVVAVTAMAWWLPAAAWASVPMAPKDGAMFEGKELELCSRARALSAAGGLEAFAADGALAGEAGDTDVISYLLDIEITPEYDGGGAFVDTLVAGTCTIAAEATIDGLSQFDVDLRANMTVNGVTGDAAGFVHVGDVIEITLDRTYNTGESFQVVVDYRGHPEDAGFGTFRQWTRNGSPVIATMSEPYYAHHWWPCKDTLGDKTTAQTFLTVPGDLLAVSNGTLTGVDVLTGNRKRYRWQESYPIIPYLVSMAITNYQQYDLVYEYDDGGPQTMPVNCFVYPDHWDFGLDEPMAAYKAGCDELLDMLTTLSGAYGQYPFVAEKYGVVETGGLTGSMEHQTISSMVRVDNYSHIMCHELAHQWWGDEVTCGTWYDIWLNEGFASYSEPIYQERRPGGGTSAFWTRVNQRRPGNPDAQVYRTDISSVWSIFSGNDVYNKGSWVLHMLRHVMGDAAFFDALADYRATYAHGSATTADFAATISASFGEDLTFFADQWVMGPGSLRYRWNYRSRTIGGQEYLILEIRQVQDTVGYGLFVMPLDIRVTTAGGSTVETVWNDGWTEYYVWPIDGAPTLVEVDEDGGVNDRNWVLVPAGEKVQDAFVVEAPPVIVEAAIDVFGGAQPGTTTIALTFSEDIGELSADDVSLVGESTGGYAAANVDYSSMTQTATVTYQSLPSDVYAFAVFDDAVSANGKALDGEVSDADWWDHRLLPSGDGQPGGDAVLGFVRLIGDGDGNGDIELSDFAELVGCLAGPNGGYNSSCDVFDFDFDGDVDLSDASQFSEAFGGSL